MGAANLMEETDCGNFLDLIDFPSDDVLIDNDTFTDNNVVGVDQSYDVVEGFPFPNDVWSSAHCQSLANADLSAELSVPYEDIVQLEWLSNFVEDSFSGGSLTMKKEDYSSINNKDSSPRQFHTSSPVSVLESSSSCSGEKTSSPPSPGSARCGRARSKRPRPATFTPRPPMHLVLPTSSVPSDSENFAESRLVIKIPRQVGSEQKKKKKIKITLAAAAAPPVQTHHDSSLPQQAVRKCLHCEITKTPQWRAGPMGPKTLCNACGVRYKSGRLFPEYRPAASPTFVPSVHSNSHKKVLEMRNKTGEKPPVAGAPAAMVSKTPELIPNDGNIQMDYM
uniref:GATA transcription factor n=1 Tax=Garcinia mangostana TaxID=58228 RepID=C6EW00_GARMA|nr:AG-motif binding protein [Garcinia mangostana]